MGRITGTNHFGDNVTQAAKAALVTAYDNAAGRPGGTPVGDLGGLTLVPGVYVDNNVPDSMTLTGILTLDGLNDTSSVFIFQSGSTLTLTSNSVVRLINGAQACNIFWQVSSSATLRTGSHLEGNILALTSITLNTNATVTGSVLARNGAVTMDTNVIRDDATCAPICGGPLVVTALAQDDASILVTWSSVANATSYNVYRAVGAGTFTLLTSTSNLTITDTDVDNGVTYRYQVSAIVDGQETERCTTAEATAIPVFPTVLAAGAAAILGVGLYAFLRRRS